MFCLFPYCNTSVLLKLNRLNKPFFSTNQNQSLRQCYITIHHITKIEHALLLRKKGESLLSEHFFKPNFHQRKKINYGKCREARKKTGGQ